MNKMTTDVLRMTLNTPDSKIHGANMGPIWGRQDPGGPHIGPMNFAIWDIIFVNIFSRWSVFVQAMIWVHALYIFKWQ